MNGLIQDENFRYIIRVLNTNLDGKRKIPYALTAIKGIGRRLAIIACKKAGIEVNRRAGDLSPPEVDKIVEVVSEPLKFGIPEWFHNSRRDFHTNETSQLLSNNLDSKLRENLERLRKIRANRGIRHMFGIKVRGQRTKSTGRRGHAAIAGKKKPGLK